MRKTRTTCSAAAKTDLGLPAETATDESTGIIEGERNAVNTIDVPFHDVDSKSLLIHHEFLLFRFDRT